MSNDNNRAKLIISKDCYVNRLKERINKGHDLLISYVPLSTNNNINNYDPFWGGRSKLKREDYPETQKNFMDDYRKWNTYNQELLKQSFNIQDNGYSSSYNSCGMHLLYCRDKDYAELTKLELEEKIKKLEIFIETADLLPCDIKDEKEMKTQVNANSKRVFIVHGHDDELRTKVELFLRQLNLDPVVLFKESSAGRTIIEKIEKESSDIAFAIVLYTPCDMGNDKKNINKLEDLLPRARQNVVFEHGYMCALLGREKVCALCANDVEIPGDLSGIVYVSADDAGMWRYVIAREMKAVGMKVDLNQIK